MKKYADQVIPKSISFGILKDSIQVKVKGNRVKHVVATMDSRDCTTFITISKHLKKVKNGRLQASISYNIPKIECKFKKNNRILTQTITNETMLGMILVFMLKYEVSDISFNLDGELTIATKKGFNHELLKNLGKTV